MLSFLYSILLKLLYPTSLSLLLLLASAFFATRKNVRRALFWGGIAVLLICGNGWLLGALIRNLEWRHLPPSPVPRADCILILSGGILPQIPPRPTIEVAEAGDRLLYSRHLFREAKAPLIICTGGVATGGIAPRAAAEDMADLLESLSVPREAILLEPRSSDTHQHAVNLGPVFKERGIKQVLLVTSAMHMPRSLGTFRRLCPGIEFAPAPTDFRATEGISVPWYRRLNAIIPTPKHLADFSEVMHEYIGIAYYRMRGWI